MKGCRRLPCTRRRNSNNSTDEKTSTRLDHFGSFGGESKVAWTRNSVASTLFCNDHELVRQEANAREIYYISILLLITLVHTQIKGSWP